MPGSGSADVAARAADPAADASAPTLTVDRFGFDPNETRLPPAELAGLTVDHRYLIQKELGQGGVGAVYLAFDRKLHDKRVVIKVLLDKSLQNSWVVQKFQQETEALARVDHPGVVGILDSGELSDGKPYLVMQYIDGVTLRSLIRPEGVPLEQAAAMIKQIGRALSAAHDKGIYHRDLKPENIMLQQLGAGEEQVKIIDFGIAKLKDSTVAASTATGATAGTVSYMAPEQLSGRPVSATMDIYAMGAIAYELVTGRKPFNPETGFELLEMQRAGVRIKPSDLRPSISEEAGRLILRALSFNPADRFQNAREFGDTLARELSEDHTTFTQSQFEPAAIPATRLATAVRSPAQQTANPSSKTLVAQYAPATGATVEQLKTQNSPIERGAESRRSWLKLAAGLLLLLAITAGIAFIIWKRDALFSAGREQTMAYSLTVQKMRDGKTYQDEFQSSGQEIFENGWKFRMNLTSAGDGYLYLINEGPAAGNAVTYNVLFPEAGTNGGSPRVTAGQKLQTAWMRFDDQTGTEKFWMVFSPAVIKELGAVADAVNERDLGEIKESAKVSSVREFLETHSSQKPEVTKDSVSKLTTIKGKGDTLVSYIELEHH
jgi:serine/threonine protein kinase